MISYFFEHNRYLSVIGIAVIIGIAMFFSRKRNAIHFQVVLTALGLQALLGFLVLRTQIGYTVVNSLAAGVNKFSDFVDVGIRFLLVIWLIVLLHGVLFLR